MGQLKEAMQLADSVLIDTNCLIYYLEDGPGAGILETELFRPISEGRIHGVISVISVMELIVKPLRDNRDDVAEDYIKTLSNYPNLEIVGVDLPIAVRAAQLRARYNFKAPDAIIAAAAIDAGTDVMLTNDEALKVLNSQLKVLLFSDFF